MRLSNRQGGKSGLRQRTDLARGRNTAAFKANIKSLLNIVVHQGDHVAFCRALRAKLGHYMIGLSAKGVILVHTSENTRA